MSLRMTEPPVDLTTDLYAVLGLDAHATPEQVRAAYRGLAQRFHPDHNPKNMAAERRMQELNRAYDVLNDPARRRAYDRLRQSQAPAVESEPLPGAGRGQRPYYRGNNWGMHAGATEPPRHTVRVSPAGFNLVVTAIEPSPSRQVTVFNDAPFAVLLRSVASPWLVTSLDTLEIAAGASAALTVAVAPGAAADLRGWRDGGVSLLTDDPRVFSPDVRITGIFLNGQPSTRHAQTNHDAAIDLRAADRAGAADEDGAPAVARGWLRRLFGA